MPPGYLPKRPFMGLFSKSAYPARGFGLHTGFSRIYTPGQMWGNPAFEHVVKRVSRTPWSRGFGASDRGPSGTPVWVGRRVHHAGQFPSSPRNRLTVQQKPLLAFVGRRPGQCVACGNALIWQQSSKLSYPTPKPLNLRQTSKLSFANAKP